MINVRRGIAVFLSVLLLLTFGGALTALQISGTFLSPSYYVDVMRRANFYEFLLTDVTTSAIDEMRRPNPGPNGHGTSVPPLDVPESRTQGHGAAVTADARSELIETSTTSVLRSMSIVPVQLASLLVSAEVSATTLPSATSASDWLHFTLELRMRLGTI